MHVAVKKGNILINILLMKTFFAYICHLYIQLYICLIFLCPLSDSRYSACVMTKSFFLLNKNNVKHVSTCYKHCYMLFKELRALRGFLLPPLEAKI